MADVRDTDLHHYVGQCQKLWLPQLLLLRLQVQIGTCKRNALALDGENWICKSRGGQQKQLLGRVSVVGEVTYDRIVQPQELSLY